MNKAVEALDRIDETIGLIRGCLSDPPELVAMNVESMKADFDGMLKDLRTYGAYWRGQALQAPDIESFLPLSIRDMDKLSNILDKGGTAFEEIGFEEIDFILRNLFPEFLKILNQKRATPSLEAIIAKIEEEKRILQTKCVEDACTISGFNNGLDKAISIIREEWGN